MSETFEEKRARWLREVHARASRPNGQISRAERLEVMRAKVRAWNGTAAERRPSGAPGVPPLPLAGRRIFSKHTEWEEFEYRRVDVGGRVLVPGGATFTNGDRSWRCEVSP